MRKLALLLLLAPQAMAGLLGPEIAVPRAGLRAARGQQVRVAAGAGGYGVVWQDMYDATARFTTVDAAGNAEGEPVPLPNAFVLAIASNGDSFLLVLDRGTSLEADLFHGKTLAAAHPVAIDAFSFSVASDGRQFLLVATSASVVLGQLFDSGGAPVGNPFTIANQPYAQTAAASNGRGFLVIVTAGSAILSYAVTSDGAVTFGSRLERTTDDIFLGRQALTWDGNSYVAAYGEYVDGPRTMIVPYAAGGAALDVPTFVASGFPTAIEPFSGGSVVFINADTPQFMRLGRNGVPIDQLPHPVPLRMPSINAARCGGGRCYVVSDFVLRGGITDLITPAESNPIATEDAQQYDPQLAVGSSTVFVAVDDTGGDEAIRVLRYRGGAWLEPAVELPGTNQVRLAAVGDRAAILITDDRTVALRFLSADGTLSDARTLDSPVLSPKSFIQLLGAMPFGSSFLLMWEVDYESSSPGTVNPPYTITRYYAIATPDGGLQGPFKLPDYTDIASTAGGAVVAAYESGAIVFGRFGERLSLRIAGDVAPDTTPLTIASNGTRSLVIWSSPAEGHIAIVDEATMTVIASRTVPPWSRPYAIWSGSEFLVFDQSVRRFDAAGNEIGGVVPLPDFVTVASGPAGTFLAATLTTRVENYAYSIVLRELREEPRRRSADH